MSVHVTFGFISIDKLQLNILNNSVLALFKVSSKNCKMMAQLDLTQAQSLMQKTKLTVYGYIRETEKCLSISIPFGLINVLILFYGDQNDKWDPKVIGKYLELKDYDLTVTNTADSEQGNVFGTRICEKKGMYQWKFKINHIHTDHEEMCIGIWRVEQDKIPPIDVHFPKGKEQGYAYYLIGLKTDVHTGMAGDIYGIQSPKTGDIVHMILDLDKLTLSFKVNDVDYGVAYDNIKQAKYRAAIWFWRELDSVTIIE